MWRFFLYQIKALGCLALIVILSCGSVWAQSNIKLRGYVYDRQSGAPIIGATLSLAGTNCQTLSDNYGEYQFNSIPIENYTLQITAIGYENGNYDNIKIYNDITLDLNVYLNQKIYYLGKVEVKGQREPIKSNNTEILFRTDIEKSKARDISELLETVPGVFIQRDGSATGKSQIKIRGCDPKQVLVLIDGQKINPSGSGIADLSTVPLAMVERIEIHKGGSSAQFGADALGGVINVITQKSLVTSNQSIEADKIYGKWGTDITNLLISDFSPTDKFSVKFSHNHKRSNGDFSFSYSVPPDTFKTEGVRINNQYHSYNYFTGGIYQVNEKNRLTFSGQLYNSHTGLPNRANDQYETASSEDKRKLFSSSFIFDNSADKNIKIDFGFSRFEQRFVNNQENVKIKFNSRFTNDIFNIRYSQSHDFTKNRNLKFGTEFRRDILYHTDYQRPTMTMGKSMRDNISAFISGQQKTDIVGNLFIDRLVFDAAVRFDYSKTRKDSTSYKDTITTNDVSNWSPNFGMVISKGNEYSYLLRAGYGQSFRLPSLNALFWKGDIQSDGNPGLKPERSEHSEAGFELSGEYGPVKITGGMTYYHSFIQDLVIWVPSNGVWRPENNEKAQITGHEDFIRIDLFDNLLALEYQNGITTAINKSSEDSRHNIHNKRLVFYPHYISTIKMRLDYRFLSASYTIRSVGMAYTNLANTRYYDGYQAEDFLAGVKFDIASIWRLSVDYKLYNIGDVNYLLMSNFPMPGREWNFGVKIIYGITH